MAGRVALSIVVVATALVGWACGPPPPQAADLASVVRAAEAAELNLDDAPASYYQDGDAAAVMQPMLDRAASTLGRYYTGSLLTEKVANEQRAIRQMLAARAGGRIGEVTGLELRGVQLHGRQAQVRARITDRFRTTQFWFQDPRQSRFWATNVIDENLHLVMTDGAWKIDAETWEFAPGGGP